MYTVYRYFLENADGEEVISFELIFETSSFDSIEDIYLFDDYALALVGGGTTFTVIHFPNFRGGEVPSNYGIDLISEDAIVGHALTTSLDGTTPVLFIALETSAAILGYRMQVFVDTKSYNSRVGEDRSASIALLKSVELTSFLATDDLIILGCSGCNSGEGWIKFYDRESLTLLHTEAGDESNMSKGTSKSLALSDDVQGVTHLWYTSMSDNTLKLNTIYASYDSEADEWDFDKRENKFSTTGNSVNDRLIVNSIGHDIIIKVNSATTIYKIKACALNTFFSDG